jgi:mannose-1-phosphate guanylyltransferase
MDAVILVGGLGTRLRPLTLERPKHVLPLVDRPLLSYLVAQCARAGIERVVLSCGYLPDPIRAAFGEGDALGVRLEYAIEPELLGTAGAIRFAAAQAGIEGTFLALNGDILSDIDLAAHVERHRAAGAAASIALTRVRDPSRYGLVRTGPDGGVRGFVEKPSADQIDTDLINAGAYVLEPRVLDLVPEGQAVSIEREVFPRLVGHGLYAWHAPGYWADVGTPASYLQAHQDVLDRRVHSHLAERLGGAFMIVEEGAEVERGAQLVPPLYVGAGARIASGARVGLGTCVGAGAQIGASTVEGSVIGERAIVGDGCTLLDSIVGAGAVLAGGCRLGELALVGPGVEVGEGNELRHGLRVFPGAPLPPGAVRF